MMQITQIDASLPTPPPKTKSDLGKNDFLLLLISQLRHQDPLNPMNDREFIAQLAQFNSLEQMTNLNKTFDKFFLSQSLSSASALIGKQVKGTDNDGNPVEGAVQKVVAQDNAVFLQVGSALLPLDKVQELK